MAEYRPHPNRLKELRERRALTQHEVATLTSQDYTTICRHESGDRPLPREALEKYARLYSVTSLELIMEVPSEGDALDHESSK